jgi:hypothetical protein
MQWVRLDRDPKVVAAATTWQNRYTNAKSKSDVWCCLPNRLVADALSLIHAFVQDYRTANPE